MSEANDLWRGDYKVYEGVPTEYVGRTENCSDEEIGELFGVYARLLGHLEALFSIFCKKRFHLNDSDVDKAILHRDAIEIFWSYLKMSVTPKLHLLFVHLLRCLERVQGFGDP